MNRLKAANCCAHPPGADRDSLSPDVHIIGFIRDSRVLPPRSNSVRAIDPPIKDIHTLVGTFTEA